MIRNAFLLSLMFFLISFSCSTSEKGTLRIIKNNSKADRIISNALSLKGTKYKYGGVTKRGMDCSGLVFVSFKKEDIILPRASMRMAEKGEEISIKNARKSDLLFFRINKNNSTINHVGLIISTKNGLINFIHSTTSRGVIISSLSEEYWKKTFVKVMRIL